LRWLALVVVAIAAPAYAQQPGWEVRVPERATVAATATTTVPVAIAVDRGLTVSRDAPVIVDLVAEPGLTVKKRRLGRADAIDPDADAPRFAVVVRGDAPGDHTVKVRIRFWLCGGKACRPIEVRRQVVVAVEP
jgi:hypothetical protein